MPDSLRARFDDDQDGTGKLLVRVSAGGFSGEGGAYFVVGKLEDFAEALSVFPLSNERRPSIAGGFWSKELRGTLDQEHLAIQAYPVGLRGQIGVQVRMATELWGDERPESQNAVRVELLTTYERLARFARELKSLVRGTVEEAVLEGEKML